MVLLSLPSSVSGSAAPLMQREGKSLAAHQPRVLCVLRLTAALFRASVLNLFTWKNGIIPVLYLKEEKHIKGVQLGGNYF